MTQKKQMGPAYTGLPGEVVKDRLTKREIYVYNLIKYLAISLLGCALLLIFVLNLFEPKLWHAIVAVILNMPAIVFSLALRTDTRVIHGVKWLREDWSTDD